MSRIRFALWSSAAVGMFAFSAAAQHTGPDTTLFPSNRVHVTVGQFASPRAAVPTHGAGSRTLGDTFDTELILADSPAMLETDYLSVVAGGQSIATDGLFQLAGSSQLTVFAIEARVTQTDNLDGTFTITVSTRVPQFSDGFLPVGFTFPGSGTPIDALAWAIGPDADRNGAPDALDPLLDAVFTPDGSFTIVAADIVLLDNSVTIGSGSFGPLPILDQDELGFLLTVGGAAGSGLDQIQVQYLVQDANAPTSIALDTPDTCLDASENTLLVDINAAGLTDLCVGGQFFLEFDTSVLDLVSIVPGDGPFVREVYESVNEGAGTIDYAVGVVDGGVGTSVPTTMARLEFAVTGDFCAAQGVVAFRASSPPSRLANNAGQDLGAITLDLESVTKDSLPPMITLPPDVAVIADAGGCAALLDFIECFDASPSLCATQTPGCWYTDRYDPQAFTSAVFDGDSRLLHSISSLDSAANRPSGFAGSFYDTQGRKHDVDIPIGERWAIDLYIDAGWATQVRRAGLWATTFDGLGDISGFPIISFTSNDPADPANPAPAMQQPRFRVYTQDTDQNPGNGLTPGWIELGLPSGFSLDRWWTLECTLTSSAYEFRVIDDTDQVVLSLDDVVSFNSIRAGNLIVQAYNFGESYDVYWDNATLGPQGPVATDDCSDVTLTSERSDNPALGFNDPFPSGTTTITWTAIDACGNVATADQLVTVDPVNAVTAELQLQAVDTPSVFDRCIVFEAYPSGGGSPVEISQTVQFVDGLGSAAFDLPCGAYDCIVARDPRHSLRSTDLDDFQIVGPQFVADFTAAGTLDDDTLRGGNLNADSVIDILDFGTFISAYGSSPGADSPCPPAGVHADISGDGQVTAADFTFIQINFASVDEAPCAPPAHAPSGTPAARSGAPRPVLSISTRLLREQGMSELVSADLNADGVLDQGDVQAFLAGALPAFLADVNTDGVISPEDVHQVSTRLHNQDPTGDINRDGSANFADLLFVIERLGVPID